jgi:hypothetical protein
MRRVITLLFATLFFAVQLSARAVTNWENVEKLKPGTPIWVLLWTGENVAGRVEGVSGTELRVTPFEWTNGGVWTLHEVKRANVQRITRIYHHRLPNSRHWMVVGTVAGGAIGATTGAISDANHHTSTARWFTGGLAGAGLGFFVSCGALAAVGVFELGSDIAHPRRVVYEGLRNSQPLLQ